MRTILVRARATDSAVYKLAETLSKYGFDVTLFIWDRQNTLDKFTASGYSIKIFNFRAAQDNWKAFFYLPVWWIYEFYYLLKFNSDIIHVCDLDTLWPGILVKLIRRKRLFYTIYDFYANNIPRMRPYMLIQAIRNVIASIEKFGIRFTNVVFLADECRYEEVRGAHINRIEYIYNSPPDCYDKSNTSLPVNETLTIFYAGGMHNGRGLEYMVKAVTDLDNVKLVLAGPESDFSILKKKCAQLIDKVQYIGWLPTYESLLMNTLRSDLLFRFNDPAVPKSKYESPNKLFEAMMCSKPIIVNAEIAASNIVNNEDCGITVPYGDVEAIKEAIIKLKDNPDLRVRLGNNGRKAYEDKYSWKIMEKRLIKAYNN